jgi:hypothetical protein
MNELQVREDGRFMSGDIPFGYTLWGDRLVEVPRELDACVTAIRVVKQGRPYADIATAVRDEHVSNGRRRPLSRCPAAGHRTTGNRRCTRVSRHRSGSGWALECS